jgi:hypothetical protein
MPWSNWPKSMQTCCNSSRLATVKVDPIKNESYDDDPFFLRLDQRTLHGSCTIFTSSIKVRARAVLGVPPHSLPVLWSCRNNRGFELEAGGFADNRGFELDSHHQTRLDLSPAPPLAGAFRLLQRREKENQIRDCFSAKRMWGRGLMWVPF